MIDESLVDTNILLCLVQGTSPQHPFARRAMRNLRRNKVRVYITTQNLIEFMRVATRPVKGNGLGLPFEDAFGYVKRLTRMFPLLPDKETIHTHWMELLREAPSMGKQIHDARFVAVMRAHQITAVLTFNASDFTRYSQIEILSPNIIGTE